MAADGLGSTLLLGYLVAEDDLEGVLIHASHEVGIKSPLAGEGEGLLQVVIHVLIAADIDLEAALEPQHGLDQPVGIVVVSLTHLGGAVDKGIAYRYLAIGALHREGNGLLSTLKERAVEFENGHELGI